MPDSTPTSSSDTKLLRTMGLFSLVVYGVGDMVGSGIYATVGKAAGQMGNAVWAAFLVSMVAALLTGLSYACIASRYPRAAGAAYVTQHAFRLRFVSYVVGLTVCASGLTSMATSSNAFAGTLADMLQVRGAWGTSTITLPATTEAIPAAGTTSSPATSPASPAPRVLFNFDWSVAAIIIGFLLFMTLVNLWGIRESMITNLICTLIEVGGLLFIIAISVPYWGSVNYLEMPAGHTGATEALRSVFAGAVLTFFAFVGFEDMLNVSEEVKDPERTMPRGMITALVIVAVIYLGVAISAVSVVNWQELKSASAPLASITSVAAKWLPKEVFQIITMFAVANTVLINYIMGSRLLYGMARQKLVPAALGRVHAKRRTPHVAILTLLVIVCILAFSGDVQTLGTATGLLLLSMFAIVNAALVVLKLRPGEPRGRFEVPVIVPILGIVVNVTLIVARVTDATMKTDALYIAGGVVVFIAILFFIMRPQSIPESA